MSQFSPAAFHKTIPWPWHPEELQTSPQSIISLKDHWQKIVPLKLSEHLENNDLFYPRQSTYRSSHSTETALLKIASDLLTAPHDSHISLLSSLDLSAALTPLTTKLCTPVSTTPLAFLKLLCLASVLPLLRHSGCFCERNLFFPICVEIWITTGFSAKPYSLCAL